MPPEEEERGVDKKKKGGEKATSSNAANAAMKGKTDSGKQGVFPLNSPPPLHQTMFMGVIRGFVKPQRARDGRYSRNGERGKSEVHP